MDDNEQRVREVFPDATADNVTIVETGKSILWKILTGKSHQVLYPTIGYGDTETAAWADAAKRISEGE